MKNERKLPDKDPVGWRQRDCHSHSDTLVTANVKETRNKFTRVVRDVRIPIAAYSMRNI